MVVRGCAVHTPSGVSPDTPSSPAPQVGPSRAHAGFAGPAAAGLCSSPLCTEPPPAGVTCVCPQSRTGSRARVSGAPVTVRRGEEAGGVLPGKGRCDSNDISTSSGELKAPRTPQTWVRSVKVGSARTDACCGDLLNLSTRKGDS